MVSPIFGNTWKPAQTATPGTNQSDTVLIGDQTSRGLDKPLRRRARTRQIRLTRGLAETVLLLVVVALAIVVAGTAVGESVLRPKTPPVITVKVQPGDTLWSLADRYGYPSEYILKRVDRLATFNNLPAGSRLQPGQLIQVPVENPAEQQRILVSNGSAR